jgi:uncharacterized protein YraI
MKRFLSFFLGMSIALLLVSGSAAQYSDTGVHAEAQNTVNLRAYPGSDTDILGQMQIGLQYAVIGRHEIFPWLLLAEPVTLRPVGWVFRDIVLVTGTVNNVPLSDLVVSTNPATPTLAQTAVATSSGTNLQASGTPAFTVSGTALGEINIRYGPGVDYPRVGIGQGGERFQIIGYHTQFPWVQIRYDASPTGAAWIAIDLLDIQGDIYSTERISSTVFNQPTLTPTPAVVQSAGGLSDTGTNASPEFLALGNRLYQFALSSGFDPQTSLFGSLFIIDLQTGESIAFGNNVAYSGTSVNKISILATLYGSLNGIPQQGVATDIANTMICSNNTATNRLLAVIGNQDEWQGAEQVTNFLRLLGIQNSYLLAPYVADPNHPPEAPAPIAMPDTEVDQSIAFPEPYNQVTVEDLAWLLAAIYQCAYEDSGPLIDNFDGIYEPRECRQMLHVMTNNNVDSLLRSGVPADVRVAHKHGWIDDTHMNAAVFFTEGGNYVVAMALHSNRLDATGERYLGFDQTLPVFAETSRQIYNYFNPDSPSLELRESFIPEAPGCTFAGTPLIGDLMQSVWEN